MKAEGVNPADWEIHEDQPDRKFRLPEPMSREAACVMLQAGEKRTSQVALGAGRILQRDPATRHWSLPNTATLAGRARPRYDALRIDRANRALRMVGQCEDDLMRVPLNRGECETESRAPRRAPAARPHPAAWRGATAVAPTGATPVRGRAARSAPGPGRIPLPQRNQLLCL